MPLPTSTPTPTVIGSVGDVVIAVQPDLMVVPGQQWIYLSYRPSGQALADFLTVDWKLTADMVWIVMAHSNDVDYRLKKLIDICAAIRLSAPNLVQLSYLPGE